MTKSKLKTAATTNIQPDDGEVGFVRSIKYFLLYLDGLPTVKINDIVQSEQGIRGLVNAIIAERVEVLLLDEGETTPGQLFSKTGQHLTIPVGRFLLGRAVNPLGIPIDGKGPLAKTKGESLADLDKEAPGIEARDLITEQFETGISLLDTLIPLGKGQRELVVGDARSGKTDFLIDIIVNQKGKNVVCVYASIGKPITDVRGLIDSLQTNQALSYTTIVATSSTDLAPLIYLTPKTAFSIAEYFQESGYDVLLILDDMGNHAKIYREMSLVSDKPPGRESYPGDIFYQHSSMLERAGKFNKESGGGSITALPVIELNLNDFTTYIPTNLMSMTDGHLLFKSVLYNQGQRPAIDIPLSVSRVGRQTQNQAQHFLSTRIRQVLAQAAQLETVSHFSFELPEDTQIIFKQAEALKELLKQPPVTFIHKQWQVFIIGLTFTSLIKGTSSLPWASIQKSLLDQLAKNPQLNKAALDIYNLSDEPLFWNTLEKASKSLKI